MKIGSFKIQRVFTVFFSLSLASLSAQSVTSFTLVNADSDSNIGLLSDGGTIDLASAGNSLNIRANTTGSVGSVVFQLTGQQTQNQTENVAPYALFGDSSGDYNVWNPASGSYQLTATPYTQSGGGGSAGTALTIHFTVVTNSGNPLYTLTVNNGTGDGNYTEGTVVPISANTPGAGQVFEEWGGDIAHIADISSANTSVTMPTNAVTVTALYSSPNDGDGSVNITGELKRWHKVSLTLNGPAATETGTPNPFLDYRMTVTFIHQATGLTYRVPGYFAADGNAAETSATGGNQWRAHLSPDHTGTWNYSIEFVTGNAIAISNANGTAVSPYDGVSGTFTIAETDKAGRDFRGKGRLQYVGERYLKFAASKEYFIKVGADAPENFLNCTDFDGTFNNGGPDYTKDWSAHASDWNTGDPTWQTNKGQGIIGAVNYLSEKGMNVFSFLTYNVGGDSKDVWPFVAPLDRLHYDCSKLDQWSIVFDHATHKGMYLHFKTQEQENDNGSSGLDGGAVSTERKLYYRELIARFGHNLALNWNLGEENTQSEAERIAMADYFFQTDPYHHNVVIHTFPGQKNAVYTPLLGNNSKLTGASLQSGWNAVHGDTIKWINDSQAANKPWVVANDEQGNAQDGIPPDAGWPGYGGGGPSRENLRHQTLWGNLMAGGAGVEAYFGYSHPDSDLNCDDLRSRDGWWDMCRHARIFFENYLPYWRMQSADPLIGNTNSSSSGNYCLAETGKAYAVYLSDASGTHTLDLSAASSDTFNVRWYDPRNGGTLQTGTVAQVVGGVSVSIGNPPNNSTEDWVALISIPRKLLFIRGGTGTGGFLEGGSDEQLSDVTNTSTSNGNHGWFELAEALREEGYSIEQVIEGPANNNTPIDLANTDLSQYAAIVLGSNNATYTQADADAIENYIFSGGGVLLISDANFGDDWPSAPTSDQLFLDRFGLVMNQDQGTYALERSQNDYLIANHPIFEQVDQFDGEGVSPISLGTPVSGVSVAILAKAKNQVRRNDTASGPGTSESATANDGSLVVAKMGRGKLAGHFDRNTFFNLSGAGTNINRFDNKRYALNLFNWLTGYSSDLQTYSSWANTFSWGNQSATPLADANLNGITNLVAYALDIDPVLPDLGSLPVLSLDTVAADSFLVLTHRRNLRADDIDIFVESSNDLMSWERLDSDHASVTETIIDADVDGDGSAESVETRVLVSPGFERMFLRVNASLR